MGPMLRMYRDYCQNFDHSLETLKNLVNNDKWTEFLQHVNNNLLNKKNNQSSTQYNLSSFLIMPVQRVPRYSLLLTELCKFTPSDHPDYENLNKAKLLIKDIASSLNEFIKDVEHRNKVLVISNMMVGLKTSLLEPHRRFVKQGQLKKITSRMVQTCYLFLFNDILVYSHRQILSNYQYNGTIPLGTAWIRNLEDTEKVKHVFQLVGTKKTWTFYAESSEIKTDWVKAMESVIDDMTTNNPSLLQQRSMVNVRQNPLLSLSFAPSDYDKDVVRNQNLVKYGGKVNGGDEESAPLLGEKKEDKCCGCCTII